MSAKSLWLGLAAVVVVVGGWLATSYNSLVGLDEQVGQKFAEIETQYQRRFDLVPNLVATVQGAANFEQDTLTAVTAARSAWAAAGTEDAKIAAANEFESALSRLLVTVEAYPQLTATAGFRDLQVQLEGTENRIAFARNEFNAAATSYNTAVRAFPRNLIASLFGFDSIKERFAAATGAENAPAVQFNN